MQTRRTGATQVSARARRPEDQEADLVAMVFQKAIGQKSPLSPQQRGILLLRVQHAMSMEDVCLTLSLTPEAYRSEMQEAECQLKAMLAGERSARESPRR